MARNRKSRRQQHGSAWHWKQTDCWYYTLSGTKKRIALFDENGVRIKGLDNKKTAQHALARVQLADELNPPVTTDSGEWTVAKVCDLYLTDLHRSANPEWAKQVNRWLNDLCGYCGALKVSEFKKKHLRIWIQRHTTWGANSQRSVIATVNAAFNFCCKFDDLETNPVAGYEKPAAVLRVVAFTPEEEVALYKTARKTGKDRRIMLCEEMETLTRRLMQLAPKESGITLFRTTHGRAWQRRNCVHHFLEHSVGKKLLLPQFTTELREMIQTSFSELSTESSEFNLLLREVVPEFHVYLVRLRDGGHLMPRAQVSLDLTGIAPDAHMIDGMQEMLSSTFTFDIF